MLPSLSSPFSGEMLRSITRHAVRDRLDALAEAPIHIPAARSEMRAIPGMQFHVAPELFLQLSGETRFTFPGEEQVVGPGGICIVPRGVPHGERVRALESPFANLVFLPESTLRFHLAHEKRPGHPGGVIGDWLDGIAESCAFLLTEAVRQWHSDHPAGKTGARGALAAVFAGLLAALERQESVAPPEPVRVMQARQQILLHLHDPGLTVASLAGRLRCSAGHLSRLFRKAGGVSLQTYLLEQRLSRACDLLKATPMNIAEISYASGFRDPAYFARAFRQWAGCTPREFRRRSVPEN